MPLTSLKRIPVRFTRGRQRDVVLLYGGGVGGHLLSLRGRLHIRQSTRATNVQGITFCCIYAPGRRNDLAAVPCSFSRNTILDTTAVKILCIVLNSERLEVGAGATAQRGRGRCLECKNKKLGCSRIIIQLAGRVTRSSKLHGSGRVG